MKHFGLGSSRYGILRGHKLQAYGAICLILAVMLGACGFQPAGDPSIESSTHIEPTVVTESAPLPVQEGNTLHQTFDADQPAENRRNSADPDPVELLIFWHAMADPDIVSFRGALKEKLEQRGVAWQEYDAENNAISQARQIREALSLSGGAASSNSILLIDPVGMDRNQREACLTADFEAVGTAAVIVLGDMQSIPSADSMTEANTESGDKSASVWSREKTLYFYGEDLAGARMQGQMVRDTLLADEQNPDLNGDGETAVWILSAAGQEARAEESAHEAFGLKEPLAECSRNPAEISALGLRIRLHCLMYRTVEEGVSDFEEILRDQDSPAEAIVCTDDEMASRILVKLQGYGYNLGDGRSITVPLFGFGGTTVCRANVEAGMMAGTVGADWEALASDILDASAAWERNASWQANGSNAPAYGRIEHLACGLFTNAS